MAYERVNWTDYDDELTFQQNVDNHAVATDSLLNYMDNGIYKANNFSVGTVESSDKPNVSIIDTGEGYTFDFEIPRGEPGIPGIDGLQGIQGEKGDPGADGRTATIRVGNVTEGEQASVINVGTDTDAIFDFVLPKGEKGDTTIIGAEQLKNMLSIGINPSDGLLYLFINGEPVGDGIDLKNI